MRKPRSFTCWSMRPRNTILPSARAGAVAGAVQARARLAERIGDEPLRGQLGPAEVAAGDAGAADEPLAGDADRDRVLVASST